MTEVIILKSYLDVFVFFNISVFQCNQRNENTVLIRILLAIVAANHNKVKQLYHR